MTQVYWAVAECITQRMHKIVREVEGAFVPVYRRQRLKDGRVQTSHHLPRFGQYVFFPTNGEDWGAIANVDGVYHVLRDGVMARRVPESEMNRIRDGNAMGIWDEIEFPEVPKRASRRRRRPRPGKRARAKAMGAAT